MPEIIFSKVEPLFKDNIWGADLPDMQQSANLIKKFAFYYVLLIFSVNMHGFSLCIYVTIATFTIIATLVKHSDDVH